MQLITCGTIQNINKVNFNWVLQSYIIIRLQFIMNNDGWLRKHACSQRKRIQITEKILGRLLVDH